MPSKYHCEVLSARPMPAGCECGGKGSQQRSGTRSRLAANRPDERGNASDHGRQANERKRIEDEHAVLLTCAPRCERHPARFQIGEHLLHRARPRLPTMSELEYERRIANGGSTEARGALPTLAQMFLDDCKQHNLAPTRVSVFSKCSERFPTCLGQILSVEVFPWPTTNLARFWSA